jgi:DNA-directed RNA polymerase subunit beta'
MATSNIFSPSSGKPILTPSQDIVLGAYYLTIEPRKKPAKNERVPLLSGLQEVLFAKADGALKVHDWVEIPNPDFGRDTVFGNKERKVVRTTVGRVIFNQIWPEGLGFVNFAVAKAKLGDLILNTYKSAGNHLTVETLDKLKELGFTTAFQAGISIGIDDMIIPDAKKDIVSESRKKIAEVEGQFNKGIITDGERYNKVVDIWTNATDRIAKEVFSKLEANEGKNEVNPVYIMMDSGARGNKQQVRQLCGTRKSSSGRSCPRFARA